MSTKRVYHRWTEHEVRLLYRSVTTSNRNWVAVQEQFPQFSLLQLQNKFTMIEKQFLVKKEAENDSVQETVRMLMELMRKRE
ncbi:Homeobox-like_domain superfamily [Hexamita inflata]|uniref:Homeobox-like domain superfamily n=1 Tax=Hexamita inflata TaxID=28002 RepID=A0AA86UDV6_9EUKA|nr:Homeobox-like domain superfamily [Hexamita inflata]CAI9948116.1 Homeobox-like domain superfamily [Hexamita inflata]